jgi:hypothetical protein
MANYKTNLWTGANGLDFTGVFPEATANGTQIVFVSDSFDNGEVHACTAVEARDDVRRFIWGVLEQCYVAYTGGRNLGTPDKPDGSKGYDGSRPPAAGDPATGSGGNKIGKMTIAKSALSLVDEDTAKTTYTIVFNYAVDTPGAGNLEVENE